VSIKKEAAKTQEDRIVVFQEKTIRRTWYKEEWWFSVQDVIATLTDSVNPSDYIKKIRSRDKELAKGWGQIVTPLWLESEGGSQRTNCANTEGLFRIIQSIPSPKAEPFKMWLAEVGKERVDEIIDPELTIDRALQTYLQKGYSREWINQRLQAIQVRKELTDTWQDHGVTEGLEYAILTNEITKAWSGMTTRQYKDFKNLKKENLRDNMSTLELVLNMLAEATTTELTQTVNPQGLEENKAVAKEGGTVAGNARKDIEARTGKPVITSKNALNFSKLIDEVSHKKIDKPLDES